MTIIKLLLTKSSNDVSFVTS